MISLKLKLAQSFRKKKQVHIFHELFFCFIPDIFAPFDLQEKMAVNSKLK